MAHAARGALCELCVLLRVTPAQRFEQHLLGQLRLRWLRAYACLTDRHEHPMRMLVGAQLLIQLIGNLLLQAPRCTTGCKGGGKLVAGKLLHLRVWQSLAYLHTNALTKTRIQ